MITDFLEYFLYVKDKINWVLNKVKEFSAKNCAKKLEGVFDNLIIK